MMTPMRFPKKKTEPSVRVEPPASKPSTQVQMAPDDLPEEIIAARAYEMWQRRGCPMGQDGMSDWFAARSALEHERLNWAAPTSDDRTRNLGVQR
jgi:hypothetical protein